MTVLANQLSAPLTVDGSGLQALRERLARYQDRVRDAHPLVGKTAPDADAIRMFSNDYLGLSGDRRINEARAGVLLSSETEALMSAAYLHEGSDQHRFERRMAAFLGAEETVLCQSGWCANDGLIQTLADAATPVYMDAGAHASLWQGAHSAGARVRPFRHNDAAHLEDQVRRYGPGIVTVDSVYSTTGDISPLFDIVDICERYGCLSVIDESHAVGVFGARGEGLVAMLGLSQRVSYRTFSLSKAFVGRGGIVAGPADVLELFRFESRPAIFSSAVLGFEIAGFECTLDIIENEYWRREALQTNADFLRSGLSDLGYNVDCSHCQIVPLEAGTEARTIVLRDMLEARGIYGAVFCPPATPRNRSLVRLSVSADIDRDALEYTLRVCGEIREAVGLEDWPSTRRKHSTQDLVQTRFREAEARKAELRKAIILRPQFGREAGNKPVG